MAGSGKVKVTKYIRSVDQLINSRGQATPVVTFEDSFVLSVLGNETYLSYNEQEGEWYFDIGSSLPSGTLVGLVDVEITNAADDNVLVYDTTTQKWINSPGLTNATQNIASINSQIAVINQTNNDQQNSIDTLQTSLSSLQTQVGGVSTVPVGGIIMWSGTTVPTDWKLCDGTNGTPDLVDRFIIGDDMTSMGSGGSGSPKSSTYISQDITLDIANLPQHTHGAGTLQPKANGDTFINFPWDRAYHPSYTGGMINNAKVDPVNGSSPNFEGIFANGVLKWDLSIDGRTDGGGYDNTPISISASSAPKKYYKLAFIMYSPTTSVFGNTGVLIGNVDTTGINGGATVTDQNNQTNNNQTFSIDLQA